MIIALANRKGGVGKTTLAVALATKLAETDRVLLVDLDSQANASESLDLPLRPEVAKWLMFGELPQLESIGQLDVIVGNMATSDANLVLAQRGKVKAIRDLLGDFDGYSYVILDCPPSVAALTKAVLYAADFVLCPTILEYLSVAGVRQLTQVLEELKEDHGRAAKLMGIQPNKFDRRTNEHKAHLTSLVRAFGAWGKSDGKVWPPLRQSIAVTTASAEGRPVWDLLGGKVRIEWENLVERVRAYG